MATNTYVALATQTLSTSTATVTFSAISQAYTDLEIVISNATNLTGNSDVLMRFNSDTGTNYSATILGGDGTSAYSARRTNSTSVICNYFNFLNTSPATQFNIKIQNYSNTTTYKPVLIRANRAAQATEAIVGNWRSISAITQIDLTLGSSSFAAGTTFTIYGIAAAAPLTAKATGGTITYGSDGYVYHTFTSSGIFAPTQSLTCDYLVVGGGGGTSWGTGGGGGAGGLRSTVRFTGGGGTAETPLSLSATSYTVTVGAAGASTTTRNAQGGAGGNSTFATITATGGAGGGGNGTNAATGGSGGGGSGTGLPGAGTTNQGYAGGAGADGVTAWTGGGGGGGAGGVGQAAGTRGTYYAGNGGAGVYLPEFAFATNTGSSGYYAGGGGGGGNGNNATAADGVGGLGGGGNGSNVPGRTTAGATNTGGGGGGSGDGEATGKPGGSGIVIVRYLGQVA